MRNDVEALAQRLLQPLRGLNQLLLQGIDLLRNILKLALGHDPGLRYFVGRAIRPAHRRANLFRRIRKPALCHFSFSPFACTGSIARTRTLRRRLFLIGVPTDYFSGR
jgi:hypothetical protein